MALEISYLPINLYVDAQLVIPILCPPIRMNQEQRSPNPSQANEYLLKDIHSQEYWSCGLNELATQLNTTIKSEEEPQSETVPTQVSPRVSLKGHNLAENLKLNVCSSKPQQRNLIEDDLNILKGYKYELSYLPSKGPRRRKRVIHCSFQDCSKTFLKAWNFLDHARMHLGEKPFQCELWNSKFTQKGNLKKHMKKHA